MLRILSWVVLFTRSIPFLYDTLGYRIFTFLLRKNFRPGIVKRNNHVWSLNNLNSIVEKAIFLRTEYDTATEEFIQAFVKNGSVCVDVGANIGYFTTMMSEKVGEKGLVYAFEASPTHFQSLKVNLELNQKGNYQLFNTAVGDMQGSTFIYTMNSTGSTVSSYSDFGLKLLSKDDVQMETLDHLLPDSPVHFIKIDVDGNELQVLKGAHQLITRYKPLICIEVCERTQRAGGSSSTELLEYLTLHGYKFLIKYDSDPVSISEVLRVSHEKNYIDILCV